MMKKSIRITIPEPCHEDWSKMTPTEKGKHCAVCEKEVIDFSKHTDEALFKLAKAGDNLCGRFNKTQLDRSITISRKRKNPFPKIAASLLLPVAFFTTQEANAQRSPSSLEKPLTYKSLNLGSLNRPAKKKLFDPFAFYVKGIVKVYGNPVAGFTASIKGTSRTTVTNVKGEYELQALPGEVLEISKTNFNTETREIDGNTQKFEFDLVHSKLEIKGMVSDASGPLPGVNVLIKGTGTGTQTDFDGQYTLEVAKGDILEFSYVGFTEEVRTITGKDKTMDILLKEGEPLEQIIIIAGGLRVRHD